MRRRLLSLFLALVMVLGMLPIAAFADEAPFTVTVDGAEIANTSESETLTWYDFMTSTEYEVPSYIVSVPAGSSTATLTFSEGRDWYYYTRDGITYIGAGETSSKGLSTFTVNIQDDNQDTVLDGISVQEPGQITAECYIQFAYAASGGDSGDSGDNTPTRPFTSIKIGGQEIAEANIVDKGIFEMGDWDTDDGMHQYPYVHSVPYYHVTVPCGTAYVDVTYPEEPELVNYNNKASGYATEIEGVDAVSSATVKGRNSFADYTKNSDNTQTVAMPVAPYVLDAEGKGLAITVEKNGGNFEAICLFAFKYDGVNHDYDDGVVTSDPTCTEDGIKTFTCSCGASYTEPVTSTGHDYQSGTCTVCGGADPNFSVEIPTGTNIQAITAVTQFTPGEAISFNMWGQDYEEIPSYIATVPEGTQKVTLTFVKDQYAAPYSDWNTGELSLSGAKVYLRVEDGEEVWKASGTSHAPTAVGDTHSIELNVADYLYLKDSYYAAYDSNNAPIYLLTFDYPVGSHVHEYSEEVTKAASCYEKGVKTFTCSGCKDTTEGHSYTQEIPMVDHAYDAGVETTAATCVVDGVKTFTCSVCPTTADGHSYTEAIPKLSHSYDEGVESTAPTCTAEGVKTFTCIREGCTAETPGHTKTEVISVVPHNYGDDKVCDDCGHNDTTPTLTDGIYQISTYDELLWFANAVNSGQTALSGALTAGITIGESWPGIGTSSKPFAGSFNGQNHTVTFSGSQGLFVYVKGTTSKRAEIKNVVTAGTITGKAGLVETAGLAVIESCINCANVTGSGHTAGIVGSVIGYNSRTSNYLTVQNCGNKGAITGSGSDKSCAGILGYAKGGATITGCYNSGTITGSSIYYSSSGVGGIAGFLQGYPDASAVSNCYNIGSVSGGTVCGGLIGSFYTSVSISNSYNAGQSHYGIFGSAYNHSPSLSKVYYLDSSSAAPVPNHVKNSSAEALYTGSRGEAKSAATLGSADFASTLGNSFKASCGGPVLSWQEPVDHNAPNGICTVCKNGDSSQKAHYKVIKSTGAGYEIIGEATGQEGFGYTFTVDVKAGYAATKMKVSVNGVVATANDDGVYSVNPTGHFYITVTGVEEIGGIQGINLPRAGNGYRVKPCEGYTTTVETGKDFKFTVEFIKGFIPGDQFEVRVNNAVFTPDENGVYTISNIQETKNITVHDVETHEHKSVKVNLTITEGQKDFLVQRNQIIMDKEFTVPYFDLSLYGYEKYYYNPYCYLDANGNEVQQTAGNRETAYNVVTTMHAFIYMTELYKLGYGEDQAGKGYSDQNDTNNNGISDFDESVSWTQGAGSSFMNLWGLGSNLNYHLNYVYPIGRPEWGSTSDQQALKDGDVLTVHFLNNGSGSAFGVFAVGDQDSTYSGTETKDRATVKQGETVDLTLYWGEQGPKYTTKFVTGGNTNLYWVEKSARSATVDVPVYDEESGEEIGGNWNREGFGNMTAAQLKTDANGKVTIDTTGVEPGIYYLAVQGHFSQGGGNTGDGFNSTGAEAGPAYFQLTVTEGDGAGEEETVVYGDINGDGEANSLDAQMIYRRANGKLTITLTDAQLNAADVNGDEEVTTLDAQLIYRKSNGKLENFPVEATE